MKYKKMGMVLGLAILAFSMTFLNSSMMKSVSNVSSMKRIENTENQMEPEALFGFRVNILHAYYYDLDDDGRFDDVYTVISISSLSGYAESLYADVYQYLTLPSGHTYYLKVHIYGVDSYFRLYTKWYNVATESGWYTFKATIENINNYGYTYAESTVIFDPPTPAPEGAMPTATVNLV